ncbi:MAG TPA: hypothetical protein VK477_03360 [Acidobacteriota bacterium]|nr:hypothetical protein [Acidobacteriota bacterium]
MSWIFAMDELAKLTRLCRNLGASTDAQAETMARQLQKRADQLAAERGITRVAAMEHLLTVMVHGRRGETPPGFTPPPAVS